MFKLIILCLVLISCGREYHKEVRTQTNIDAIIEKERTYKSLVHEVSDEHGFIESDRCDSLLFSSLLVVSDLDIDIKAARDEDTGKWFRTPYKDCYSNELSDTRSTRRSGSEISRDMYSGLLWALHHLRDLVSLEKLIDYGREHNWIMGKGSVDRTYLTPNFQDTLFRISQRDYHGPPYFWIDPIKDHQRHVVALNIALRGDKDGKISDSMLSLIQTYYADNPNNALYSFLFHRYTDGLQVETISILMRQDWFPSSRLPRESDRCGRWLWEKSDDHYSHRPCKGARVHSGGDFLFIAYLLRRSSVL